MKLVCQLEKQLGYGGIDMGTHAAIGIINDDHTVTGIYCHWDGYLTHTGYTLSKYYDREKTIELMKLGDLSLLGKDIGEKHNSDVKDWCISYKRDRGETGTDCKVFENIESFIEEYSNGYYIYILDLKNIWNIYKSKKWHDIVVPENWDT